MKTEKTTKTCCILNHGYVWKHLQTIPGENWRHLNFVYSRLGYSSRYSDRDNSKMVENTRALIEDSEIDTQNRTTAVWPIRQIKLILCVERRYDCNIICVFVVLYYKKRIKETQKPDVQTQIISSSLSFIKSTHSNIQTNSTNFPCCARFSE